MPKAKRFRRYITLIIVLALIFLISKGCSWWDKGGDADQLRITGLSTIQTDLQRYEGDFGVLIIDWEKIDKSELENYLVKEKLDENGYAIVIADSLTKEEINSLLENEIIQSDWYLKNGYFGDGKTRLWFSKNPDVDDYFLIFVDEDLVPADIIRQYLGVYPPVGNIFGEDQKEEGIINQESGIIGEQGGQREQGEKDEKGEGDGGQKQDEEQVDEEQVEEEQVKEEEKPEEENVQHCGNMIIEPEFGENCEPPDYMEILNGEDVYICKTETGDLYDFRCMPDICVCEEVVSSEPDEGEDDPGVPPTPVCGDAILQPPEMCDGPLFPCPPGQACVACACIVPPPLVPVCGNGVIEGNEVCEWLGGVAAPACPLGFDCIPPGPANECACVGEFPPGGEEMLLPENLEEEQGVEE